MTQSKIEWTEQVWNPLAGCTVHSPGCTNCYAMRDAWRKQFNPNAKIAAKYAGTVEKTKGGQLLWTGRVNFSEEALVAPLRRRVPTRYFVNSMSDLFHAQVPDETIDRVFAVMALCPQHTFQVLTKRSDRMRRYFANAEVCDRIDSVVDEITFALVDPLNRRSDDLRSTAPLIEEVWPLPNVWLGVSVEDQARADQRREDLRGTPAAVRWVSYEPALEVVDWAGWEFIDWMVDGGETGPNSRPVPHDAFRLTRDWCSESGVAYFHKQNGDWIELDHFNVDPETCGLRTHTFSPTNIVARCGKKAAGRLLDGVLHDGFPA